MGISGIIKLIAIVIVGLFVVKVGSKWMVGKFPNKVTSSVDAVIQSA